MNNKISFVILMNLLKINCKDSYYHIKIINSHYPDKQYNMKFHQILSNFQDKIIINKPRKINKKINFNLIKVLNNNKNKIKKLIKNK